MKKFLLALSALTFSLSAFAAGDDDAFYGKIEKMPSAQNPTWVIGGKTFKADARTKVESPPIVYASQHSIYPRLWVSLSPYKDNLMGEKCPRIWGKNYQVGRK